MECAKCNSNMYTMCKWSQAETHLIQPGGWIKGGERSREPSRKCLGSMLSDDQEQPGQDLDKGDNERMGDPDRLSSFCESPVTFIKEFQERSIWEQGWVAKDDG